MIGTEMEKHCIRPGRYRITLWKQGVPGPLRTMEIDYVQIASTIQDLTPGAPQPHLGVEEPVFDPDEPGLVDNVVLFDLTGSGFSDTGVLDIDTARTAVASKAFGNDPSPSGLHTDWFRFSGQRSTSNWSGGGISAGNAPIQGRLYYDVARQEDLRSGYYSLYASASGTAVLRVFQYDGKLLGDTSATVLAGLETRRPDEGEASLPDVSRPVDVIVGSAPPTGGTYAMPAGVLESASTWLTTDQYLNAAAAESGSNLQYSWQFDGASWLGSQAIYDFSGFATSGLHEARLRVTTRPPAWPTTTWTRSML